MHGIVKYVFATIAMVVLATLLYIIFFVGDNSAMRQVCSAVERPIATSYYKSVFYPSTHINDNLDEALAMGTYGLADVGVTDLSGDSPTVVDNASDYSVYNTGWISTPN